MYSRNIFWLNKNPFKVQPLYITAQPIKKPIFKIIYENRFCHKQSQ